MRKLATCEIDRLSPCQRPRASCIGYQTWTNLLFVHWRLPADQLAPLLPAELTVDTFDGDAWVGLVPFHMSGVRPWWCPAVPLASTFHETNVRTYVHYRGRDPGVWFFSLEASRLLPVLVARARWCLNYHFASMKLKRTGRRVRYQSQRRRPGQRSAGMEAEVQINDSSVFHAQPGTLEHFLAERYILYAQARTGRLLRGQVHHPPYPLQHATLIHLRESLLAASNIHVHGRPCHTLFSPGVNVEIFGLAPIA